VQPRPGGASGHVQFRAQRLFLRRHQVHSLFLRPTQRVGMVAGRTRLRDQFLTVQRAKPRRKARPQLRELHKRQLQLTQLRLRQIILRIGTDKAIDVGGERSRRFQHSIVARQHRLKGGDHFAIYR
jgi:hypothetical protein